MVEDTREEEKPCSVISAAGLLLVSIGVIGEGIYEAKLGIADTRIRQIDESRAQAQGMLR